jgi:hypothetical protein
MVAPLIWLLGFDVVVCIVWWLIFKVLGVQGPPRLLGVMGILVIAINVIVVLVWLLGVLGVTPASLMQGPRH